MKSKTLSVRVESELVARIEKFEALTGVDKALLVRSAIGAVLDFQEANGFISFPIEVVPKEPRNSR
jgi:predicted DNA-binding protein